MESRDEALRARICFGARIEDVGEGCAYKDEDEKDGQDKVVLCFMVLLKSFDGGLGVAAPDFDLPGVDGERYTLVRFSDADVLVVVFMCNHCPYVQACVDRLVALQRDFFDRGVRFVGINANDDATYPEDDFPAMQEFARARGVNFPYLHDASQAVARAYGAVCTPDIFVYDRARTLRYHGRIDDNWQDAARATTHELADALVALTSGGVVDAEQHPSMGCSIKWKR